MSNAQRSRPQRRGAAAPAVAVPSFDAERALVVAILALTIVGFLSSANDIFGVTKATILQLGALALAATWGWRALASRRAALPVAPFRWFLLAFVGLLLLTSLIADRQALSFYGDYGRSAGVFTFLAAAVIAAGVGAVFRGRDLHLLVWAFVGSTVLVVAYGLLQVADADPFPIDNTFAGVGSMLGQPNFLAAYLGMVVPFLLWAVLRGPRWAQVVAAVTVPCLLLLEVKTNSFQGVVAVAVAVVAMGGYLGWQHLSRRSLSLVLGGLVVVGGLGLLVLRHELADQLHGGLDERQLIWRAAINMFKDHPILGNGMSSFYVNFSHYRPAEHAVRFGVYGLADEPHSVPLSMLVSGGIVLALAYVAFVGYVGWSLVTGLRRTTGEARLLLATFGAAWLAYQVQSVVSIDTPALTLVHLVVGAAVVVAARQGDLVVVGPGRQRGRRGRAAEVDGGTRAGQAAIVLVALVLAWFGLRPLRADIAFAKARDAQAVHDDVGAEADFRTATSLAPWHAIYWANYAGQVASAGDPSRGLDLGLQALRRDPGLAAYALSAAQQYNRVGLTAKAKHWYEQAERISPNTPQVLEAHARFLWDQHQPRAAIPLARRAADLGNGTFEYALLTAQLYDAVGDHANARAFYLRTLQLAPSSEEALRALGRIP